MTGSRAANRYAKAVLSYAEDEKSLEAVFADMTGVLEVMKSNEELENMIQSPVIKNAEKSYLLKNVFADFSASSLSLLEVLIENKRINLLPLVASRYLELYDELKGKVTAYVTSAVPLTGEVEKKILEKVTTLTGKEVEIENTVDESLIGGFILRVGDVEYNASVSNKLQNLEREFLKGATA